MADPRTPAVRLAVLGSPIAHSLSPRLHAAAYAVLGLDWTYEAVECTGAGLGAFVAGLGSDWRGLSLTMPLKRDVLPLLDLIDDTARLAGAANTLLLERDAAGAVVRRGANTDVAGIVRALEAAGVERSERAVVLGAGSTARSAVVALARSGAREVVVAARRPEQGRELAPLAHELGLALLTTPLDAAVGALRDADTVVSTLPGDAAAAVPLPAALTETTVLLDVTYAPWPTGIASAVGARGRPRRAGDRHARPPGARPGAAVRRRRRGTAAARRGARAGGDACERRPRSAEALDRRLIRGSLPAAAGGPGSAPDPRVRPCRCGRMGACCVGSPPGNPTAPNSSPSWRACPRACPSASTASAPTSPVASSATAAARAWRSSRTS
ncbi:shikimate dehydrogenase family protein [Clavibacter michiganensis]|uniref:shikimate dehydrogenase family protein n=1 Tax=Clavibacter michiganensis TaxID=28447 RepID=UPI003EBC44C0